MGSTLARTLEMTKDANAGHMTLRRRLLLTETSVSGDKAVRPKRTLNYSTDIN